MKRWHYGWNIVAALAVTETISYGILYYAFSVYIEPLEMAFGWNRAQVSGALSLAVLVSGLLTVPVGIWLDSHSARGLMTIGSIIGALGYFAFSQVTTLTGLYVVWAVIGVAMALVFYDPAFTVATKWLPEKRATALAWITLTAGFASTIFLPLANWLFETYGRVNSQIILAVIIAVGTIPLHAFVLRPAPALPKPDPNESTAASEVPDVLHNRSFWLLVLGFSMIGIATYGSRTHAIPMFVQLGLSAKTAALAAGVIGAMQVLGRAIYIPLGKRISTQPTVIVLFLLQGLAMGILYVMPTVLGVWIFVVLSGAVAGALTLMRPVMLGDLYGPTHFGRINAYASLGQLLAITAGPITAGAIYTAFGNSYDGMLILFGAISVLAAGAIVAIQMEKF